MFTVNNKLVQNFDHLVDLDSLLKLRPFISAYIANNGQYCRPTKFGRMSFFGDEQNLYGVHDAIEHHRSYINDHEENLKSVIQELFASDQFGSYIIYEEEVTHTSLSFNTRYNTQGLFNKHRPECVGRVPCDYQLQFFYNWLDAQNIFSQYGRVLLFISHPGSKQITHFDPSDPEKATPDEFIWINFHPNRKKLFLLNKSTEEKTYINGHVNWFNTDNFHGGDPVQFSSYALRVDGVFSDEFRSKFIEK